MAYRKAEKRGARKKRQQDGTPKHGGGKVRGDGQTLNGLNQSTGKRNQCYRYDSEYHLVPRCPSRDTPRGACNPVSQEPNKGGRPSYLSVATDPPVSAQKVEHLEKEETTGVCEQRFSTTVDAGNLFLVSRADSVVALDTGAAANLACFSWL